MQRPSNGNAIDGAPPVHGQRAREFDVVIVGAAGVSGRLVAERIAARASEGTRCALAGRDEARLIALRDRILASTGATFAVEVLDVADGPALRSLVARASVVVNTVGPYLELGNRVVAACVDLGTDYCDLCGEVPFIRRCIDAFHESAAASGARIVHACGYDCIPSDLGVLCLQQALDERGYPPARSITTYVCAIKGAMSGGSAASLVVQGELAPAELARANAPRSLNPGRIDGRAGEDDSGGPSYDPLLEQWVAPFFMVPIDTRVVRRSVALMGDPWGVDFVYREAMVGGVGVRGWARAAAYAWGMKTVLRLSRRAYGRRLLRWALPGSGTGPTAEVIESGHFRHLVVPSPEGGAPPLVLRVEGTLDPGYGETSRMLAESALLLASGAATSGGGVLTPATAFGLRLVDRLRDAGMIWRVEPWPKDGTAPTV